MHMTNAARRRHGDPFIDRHHDDVKPRLVDEDSIMVNGTRIFRNGTRHRPDGVITHENGTVVHPNGTHIHPNGTRIEVNQHGEGSHTILHECILPDRYFT